MKEAARKELEVWYMHHKEANDKTRLAVDFITSFSASITQKNLFVTDNCHLKKKGIDTTGDVNLSFFCHLGMPRRSS